MWLNAIYANYAASHLPLCVICRVIAGACCLPHGHALVLNCASLLAAQIKQIFADYSSCLFPSLSLWGIGKYGARWIPFRVTLPTVADCMQKWCLSLDSHGYRPSRPQLTQEPSLSTLKAPAVPNLMFWWWVWRILLTNQNSNLTKKGFQGWKVCHYKAGNILIMLKFISSFL